MITLGLPASFVLDFTHPVVKKPAYPYSLLQLLCLPSKKNWKLKNLKQKANYDVDVNNHEPRATKQFAYTSYADLKAPHLCLPLLELLPLTGSTLALLMSCEVAANSITTFIGGTLFARANNLTLLAPGRLALHVNFSTGFLLFLLVRSPGFSPLATTGAPVRRNYRRLCFLPTQQRRPAPGGGDEAALR